MATKLIVGHSVNDLDCLGSLALARYLYPDHTPVKSGRLHPGASKLYTLFRDNLNFASIKDIKGLVVDEMVVLDTRSLDKIQEYLQVLEQTPCSFEVWDHHCCEPCTIPGARLHEIGLGANTSSLALELKNKGIPISSEDATVALTAIYGDTGSFQHDNVQPGDFEAAAWLAEQGASLTVVRKMLNKLNHSHQQELFHSVLGNLDSKEIHKHRILFSFQELPKQLPGLSAVIEQVMEVEDCDALFVIFKLVKEASHLIIARSSSQTIDLNSILSAFGGGGHPQASSALIKHSHDIPVLTHLNQYLQTHLNLGVTAQTIMRPVQPILETSSLLEASLFLEQINNSGAAVMNGDGRLTGILTLRDIQKGRKSEQMHAPVKAYMSKKLVTIVPETSLREIEQLFYLNDIGHLPVLADSQLLGMVSRKTYLKYIKKEPSPIQVV